VLTTRTLIAGLTAAASLVAAAGALAIGNGTPDGAGHPNVGMLALEIGGDRFPVCSGSYAGAQKGVPGAGVFLTAGHCVAWIPGTGITASQLWVTFDTTATFDPVTLEVTGATTWYQAAAFAFDPAFGRNLGNLKDYAVVLLGSDPGHSAPDPGLRPDRLAGRSARVDRRKVQGVDRLLGTARGRGRSRPAAHQRDRVLADRDGGIVGPPLQRDRQRPAPRERAVHRADRRRSLSG
jgi:hypothetical protein